MSFYIGKVLTWKNPLGKKTFTIQMANKTSYTVCFTLDVFSFSVWTEYVHSYEQKIQNQCVVWCASRKSTLYFFYIPQSVSGVPFLLSPFRLPVLIIKHWRCHLVSSLQGTRSLIAVLTRDMKEDCQHYLIRTTLITTTRPPVYLMT